MRQEYYAQKSKTYRKRYPAQTAAETVMPRPRCCRFIERDPHVRLFKPCGVIMRDLPVVDLPVDGL